MSIPFRLRVPSALYQEVVKHALTEQPNECCGLLAGVREMLETPEKDALPIGRVIACYPLLNAANNPCEYLSESRSLLVAHRAMRERGLDLLAIYHSHPTTEPVPSRTDLERNFYGTEVIHLIVSPQSDPPRLRGWWLTATAYQEADWEVIAAEAAL